MPELTFRKGRKSDIKLINTMGVDIGGDMEWDGSSYFVAFDGDKLVGFFNISYIDETNAHGSGLAVHPDYRYLGIGTSLIYMGLQEARRKGVEWVVDTFKHYSWRFFTNRGWYTCPRDKLPKPFDKFKPLFEDMHTIVALRPLGKKAKEIKQQGGLFSKARVGGLLDA